MLPCRAVILHAVGRSDQPAWTDDGRSAHVTVIFDVQADLPGILPFLCVLTAHDTRRLELTPPAVCKVNNQSPGWHVATRWCSALKRKFTSVLSCKLINAGFDNNKSFNLTNQTEVLIETYRSSPRPIRLRSLLSRHILGSLYWCIYCFYIYMWVQCSDCQYLQREKERKIQLKLL